MKFSEPNSPYTRCFNACSGYSRGASVLVVIPDVISRRKIVVLRTPWIVDLAEQAVRWESRLRRLEGPHVYLLHCSQQSNLLAITLPALCADAAGLHCLIRQLAEEYEAQVEGVFVPREVVQYADIAAVLNYILKSEETSAGRDFWLRQKIQDLSPLAFSLSGSAQAIFLLKFSPAQIRPDSWSGAIGSCVQIRARLLAAFAILFHRLSGGREDFTLAVMYSLRTHDELRDTLGPLNHFLPIQFSLNLRQSFRQVEA